MRTLCATARSSPSAVKLWKLLLAAGQLWQVAQCNVSSRPTSPSIQRAATVRMALAPLLAVTYRSATAEMWIAAAVTPRPVGRGFSQVGRRGPSPRPAAVERVQLRHLSSPHPSPPLEPKVPPGAYLDDLALRMQHATARRGSLEAWLEDRLAPSTPPSHPRRSRRKPWVVGPSGGEPAVHRARHLPSSRREAAQAELESDTGADLPTAFDAEAALSSATSLGGLLDRGRGGVVIIRRPLVTALVVIILIAALLVVEAAAAAGAVLLAFEGPLFECAAAVATLSRAAHVVEAARVAARASAILELTALLDWRRVVVHKLAVAAEA
eukprot:CAMPEP_0115847312 /NCGR_PEP_ID=MMETSP0287-20121206/10317_1 /TAXON_ID=412157 /ORGANISM="Chrysochromulina rotalis, Strain UIO044" /LENGTH=324 /DNA_ID=CAMNT_0003301141 /DNA_START=367 /DNA_END=1340 /DNA_ORIENTATION=-